MYGVVPSKRNKGYGTIICKLLIEKAKEYGINNIIITCNNDNIASAKVIINNNGELFESIKDKENNIIDRYIIKK
jgi:predicted acetyltransferase